MAEKSNRPARRPRKYYPHPRFPGEIDAQDIPDVYAVKASGDCLKPLFPHGTTFVFSKLGRPQAGDYVGIWFDPDTVPDGEMPRQVKRLAFDLPEELHFPYKVPAIDGVDPMVVFDMLNPPRRLQARASRIIAMHKVIGTAVSNGDGTARMLPLDPAQMEASHG